MLNIIIYFINYIIYIINKLVYINNNFIIYIMRLIKLSYLYILYPVFSKRAFSNIKTNIKKKLNYIPKTQNQLEYYESLNNKNIDLLFCNGPAGSGKTLFACKYAIEELSNNNINKIVITRPTITIDEDLGFLPGNIKDKMHPWTIPIFDIFEEYYSKKDLTKLVSDNIIEISPLGFMQGRTFKNSIIIADEMQNSTPSQMFMLLTRFGKDSKMIITGDLTQTNNKDNGLNDILLKLNNNYYNNYEMVEDKIKIIKFEINDIQRHNIVSVITKLY